MTDIVETGVESAVHDAFTRALTNFKGTFSFERSVSRGEYSNSDKSTAAIHVQFDYSPDATAEEFLAAAREAALQGKALVFEQLGIEAHLQGAGGDAVLMEVIQDEFPGSTVENVQRDQRDPQSSSASPPVDAVADSPPNSKTDIDNASDTVKKAMRKENTVWAKARYKTHPNEFRDNRESNAEKGWNTAPDFKHKTHAAAFWAD